MALPNPFQSATVPPPVFNSTPKAPQNDTSFLCGYRSKFNINEQKEQYQQRVNQQKPHFYRNNQQQNQSRPIQSNQNEGAYQQSSSNKNHWCDLCDCGFKYPQQLEKHLDEHEKCWFDNCNFEGHTKLLQKHIETQHPSGLFKRVGRVETDEDIEKWREERRKRYPTKANIEARQLAQEERLKRGERINEPNNRFGNMKNRKSAQQHSFSQNDSLKNESRNKKNDKKRRRNRNNKSKSDKYDDHKPNDVNESVKLVSEEKVVLPENVSVEETLSLSDQCTSEPKEKTVINALTALGMYGSDSDSDDDNLNDNIEATMAEMKEDSEQENNVNIDANTTQNITTSSDPNLKIIQSNEDELIENINRKRSGHEVDELPAKLLKIETINPDELAVQNPEIESDNDAPEEQAIQRQSAIAEDTPEMESGPTQIKPNERKKPNSKTLTNEKITKRRTVLDMTRKIRNQNTLLEKLLQKDIRHERNVLLQCVRYVVENNFFGIGQKTDEQK